MEEEIVEPEDDPTVLPEEIINDYEEETKDPQIEEVLEEDEPEHKLEEDSTDFDDDGRPRKKSGSLNSGSDGVPEGFSGEVFTGSQKSLSVPSSEQVTAEGSEIPDIHNPQLLSHNMYYETDRRVDQDQTDVLELFDLDNMEQGAEMEVEEAIEEESVESVEEEELPGIDRDLYYDKYEIIMSETAEIRVINNIYQKLVIKHLKRRKVENIIKESEPPLDQVYKYGKKLDAYQEAMWDDVDRRTAAARQIAQLKAKRSQKRKELEELFQQMQHREETIGRGLIYSKTGNVIPDKLVERFIRRQANLTHQVSTMRLKFIKLGVMVQEKLDSIAKIDLVENNLLLTDYEQLKAENRMYADKIEERDEELTRFRAKCQNTIQVLAHMREKSCALDSDVQDLRDEYTSAQGVARDARQTLSDIKRIMDKYRQMVFKMKDESGLLTKCDLLRDMDDSQKELVQLEGDLVKYREEVIGKEKAVRSLRCRIKKLTDGKMDRKSPIGSRKPVKNSTEPKGQYVYKKRPTLVMPVIPQTAFDDLVQIKPGIKRK